jgi:hypothetical protein
MAFSRLSLGLHWDVAIRCDPLSVVYHHCLKTCLTLFIIKKFKYTEYVGEQYTAVQLLRRQRLREYSRPTQAKK